MKNEVEIVFENFQILNPKQKQIIKYKTQNG
jgi:hypothetical protein